MAFDVWKTLYTDKFDSTRFLYHYSSFDKAIKILQSGSLRFSPINKTNDTVEAKVRISFVQPSDASEKDYALKTQTIYNYFTAHHPEVRLLCFSTDHSLDNGDLYNTEQHTLAKYKYYDVSGRGFALPRMWSQYADNNQGVCFVFDKEKLLDQAKKSIALCQEGMVSYKKCTDYYYIDEHTVETLYTQISTTANGSLAFVPMMQNTDFIQYNFFQKLEDWKNEREYRIIALTGNEAPLFIQNLPSFLEGIVIGENIDPAYEEVIKLLVSQHHTRCAVKKISFSGQICKLK